MIPGLPKPKRPITYVPLVCKWCRMPFTKRIGEETIFCGHRCAMLHRHKAT